MEGTAKTSRSIPQQLAALTERGLPQKQRHSILAFFLCLLACWRGRRSAGSPALLTLTRVWGHCTWLETRWISWLPGAQGPVPSLVRVSRLPYTQAKLFMVVTSALTPEEESSQAGKSLCAWQRDCRGEEHMTEDNPVRLHSGTLVRTLRQRHFLSPWLGLLREGCKPGVSQNEWGKPAWECTEGQR